MRLCKPIAENEISLMVKYTDILFDFDGTLFNTGEGIMNAAQYALTQMGIEVKERAQLQRFIGPPVTAAFRNFYGMDAENAEKAKAFFRKYYAEKGVFECCPYAGAKECLTKLKAEGVRLSIATSKPEVHAEAILKRFQMRDYFAVVAGALLDDSRVEKADVLAYALSQLGLKGDLSRAVLIGDRNYDVYGAHACGIKCIGIRIGFSEQGELEQAKADEIADDYRDLMRLLLTES